MIRYTFSCVLLAAAFAVAPPARAGDLYIEVAGVAEETGIVTAVVYDKAGYLQPAFALARLTAKPRNGAIRIGVGDLPGGEYAVVAFHDRNYNDKLDRDGQGIPTEAYGFSNNARPEGLKPPGFAAAAISVEANGPTEARVQLTP